MLRAAAVRVVEAKAAVVKAVAAPPEAAVEWEGADRPVAAVAAEVAAAARVVADKVVVDKVVEEAVTAVAEVVVARAVVDKVVADRAVAEAVTVAAARAEAPAVARVVAVKAAAAAEIAAAAQVAARVVEGEAGAKPRYPKGRRFRAAPFSFRLKEQPPLSRNCKATLLFPQICVVLSCL